MAETEVQNPSSPQAISEHGNEEGDNPPILPSIIPRLYVGYFLARWGPRMWEFSVGLYMIRVWPNSLLLAAIYGAVESASTALFGPVVGRWVDRYTYFKVLLLWCLTQFVSSMVAGLGVIGLLVYSKMKQENLMGFITLVVLTNVSGAVGVLSTLSGTILIEREWVVVIAEGRPEEVLTKMNSVIRRIDLICKLCAPVVTGFIISFASLKASAMTLALWNAVTVWLQYLLLMSVYKGIPLLSERSKKKIIDLPQGVPEDGTANAQPEENLLGNDGAETELAENIFKKRKFGWVLRSAFVDSWRVYLQQDVVLPGMALSLLYFTVLSFGTLITATLQWKGIPTYIIGIARGISATVGVAATILYPLLQSRISTLRTGLWSIWSQWTFLSVCVGSILVKNHIIAAYMLMAGVATSRLGLWMFDLSVTQQMQDAVSESERCVVGGVQNSLQSILDLMAYVMGIIISKPQDFWKLTLLSYAATTLSAALFVLHIYRVRKHIFHFEKVPLVARQLIHRTFTSN